jgi:hypothetical protein
MKNLFTLALTVTALAAFATSTFAGGSCGGCADGDKPKDKTTEGTQG